MLQGVFLDIGSPANQLIYLAEDNLDLGIRKQWREFEIMLRELTNMKCRFPTIITSVR